VRLLDCESCQRCIPRYLCVTAVVSPGPYSDIECCDPDGYGNGQISFRMTFDCASQSWSGSQTCTGVISALDLTVSLSRPPTGECNTIVTSSSLETPMSFEGVLPEMAGVIETDTGDVFEWAIGTADVVENPLVKERCSPCSCTTCLPRRLCLHVAALSLADGPAINEALSAVWDCDLKRWILESAIDGFDATIALKPVTDQVCGIDVSISGDYGSYEGEILLEGPLNSRKFHGTLCKDSDELLSTLGVPELHPCDPPEPCEDPPPQDWTSFINQTVTLADEYGHANGTVTIRDQSCGDCVVDNCGSETPGCCPDAPQDLYVTDGATTAHFENFSVPTSYVWGQFSGAFPGQTTPWFIFCQDGAWFIDRLTNGGLVALRGSCGPPMSLSGGGFTVGESP
jgi:hypothetical protein